MPAANLEAEQQVLRIFAAHCYAIFNEPDVELVHFEVRDNPRSNSVTFCASYRREPGGSAEVLRMDIDPRTLASLNMQTMFNTLRQLYVQEGIRIIAARRGGKTPTQIAEETLRRFLSPEQLASYTIDRSFVVRGNATGRYYKILPDRSTNIRELDRFGNPWRAWCFVPVKALPVPDVQLMQKLCLECDEKETMKIAVDQGPVHPTVPIHIYEQDTIQMRHEEAERRRPATEYQEAVGRL